MPIFEITHEAITAVPVTTFEREGIAERGDLQRILRSNVGAIAPDCLVLAEEYGDWADAKRRIDLLCIDSEANLVVMELKRTEDGGHADLQAIRYAAMISVMTFDDAVNAHAAYLKKSVEEARQAILDFLKWESPQKEEFAQEVRVVLVSAEFSKELTSTALWLSKKGIDVRCVRLKPYKIADRTLVDIQQIIPLPEAADYQSQLRKKEEEERQSRSSPRALTGSTLHKVNCERMQKTSGRYQTWLSIVDGMRYEDFEGDKGNLAKLVKNGQVAAKWQP